MRIALATLLVVLVFASSARAEPYQWSISGSSTDPYVNTGVPSPGVHDLFLWLTCANDGATRFEFGLETVNGQIVGFDYGPHAPIPGGVALVGCVTPTPTLILRMIAFDEGGGVNVCFDVGGLGTLGVDDCDSFPELFPVAYVGYSSDGTAPCEVGTCEEPVSVGEGDSTWGSIKGLYR